MKPSVLFLYLFGSRKAILQVAREPRALWMGLILVMTAGIAREYDQQYLLGEFYYFLIPPVASFCVSALLYATLRFFLKNRETGPYLQVPFRSFLTLFWMTGPIAWLYAIPYERFFDAYHAAVANYLTLGAVSLWRVGLITRVASVLSGVRFARVLPVVLVLADLLAVVAAILAPKPLINVMGGMSYSPVEQLTLNITLSVIFWGIVFWPVFLFGAIVARFRAVPRVPPVKAEPGEESEELSTFRPAIFTALGFLILGAAFLALVQSEQYHRWKVSRLLDQRQYGAAVEYLSRRTPQQFPPLWRPLDSPQQTRMKEALNLAEAAVWGDAAPWVRRAALDDLVLHAEFWTIKEEIDRLMNLLEAIPEGPEIARSLQPKLEFWGSGFTEETPRLQALIEMGTRPISSPE